MSATQDRVPESVRGRSVQVTGRQLASPPLPVHDQLSLDWTDGAVGSSVDTLEGLQGVQRLRAEEDNGYPLRRTLLVVFNRVGRQVTAEFKEVAAILEIRGLGADEADAFRDLERQFDLVVRTKVRIPPH